MAKAGADSKTTRIDRQVIGGAVLMVVLAAATGWFGLQVNSWYGASLGKTAEANALLAGLSVVGDAVALVLPPIAGMLWPRKRRLAACAGWMLWLTILPMAFLAAVGFASTNI